MRQVITEEDTQKAQENAQYYEHQEQSRQPAQVTPQDEGIASRWCFQGFCCSVHPGGSSDRWGSYEPPLRSGRTRTSGSWLEDRV